MLFQAVYPVNLSSGKTQRSGKTEQYLTKRSVPSPMQWTAICAQHCTAALSGLGPWKDKVHKKNK